MTKLFHLLTCALKFGVIPRFSARQHTQSGLKCQKKLKIMFFGTDDFAVKSLSRIHQEYLNGGCVEAVEVTCLQMKSLIPAVVKFAKENDLKVHTWPPDLDVISRENFDMGVVASFGKLIPERVIERFPLGIINVHGSLLPRWRGAAPVIHSLINGDKVTGVSIMRVKPKRFDAGEIFAMKEVTITEDMLRTELTRILASTGADLLMQVISNFDKYLDEVKYQDEREVTYAPLVNKDISKVDWSILTNIEVYNLWRAVGDMYKLRTFYSESSASMKIGIILPPSVLDGAELDEGRDPGSLVFLRRGKRKKFVCVKCRVGWVAISDIYYHNKKVMTPTDFYNGFLTKPGNHRLVNEI